MMIKAALKRFLRSWANQTQLQITTTSVLIGTFTILFMAISIFQGVASGLDSYRQSIQMTAYLSSDEAGRKHKELSKSVEAEEGVKSVAYVSAEEAMAKFKEKMADHLPEMFFESNLENPLPDTLEIELEDDLLANGQEARVKALASSLKTLPGVEDVSFGFNWAQQFSRVTEAVTMSGGFLILILFTGGLFVIGNSVNQAVFQKRDEIEIMELFGATRKAIVVPFVVEGALTGLLAGVFALILSSIAMLWLNAVITEEMGILGSISALKPLGLGSSVVALLVCGLMGATGAYLFVTKITTGWAAAMGNKR